jgi:cbb3-type cytochrome c oxidase subunit III
MRTSSIALILTAIIYVASLAGVGAQAPKGGNPEAAKLKNPVEKTPESAAAGRKVYQRLCVRCHGAEGKGDGGAAGAVPPSDFTDDVWDHGSSDGEIFTVIHDGTSADMEGYAQRISDTDIWNVVNYIRTFGAAK